MKKRPYLVLVLTAILTVVCQCSMTDREVKIAGHPCRFTGSFNTDNSDYDGNFTCTNPDGSNLTCPNTGKPAPYRTIITRDGGFQVVHDDHFWDALGCNGKSTPTPTATPLPTSTTTATPFAAPAAASAPLLTGEVSACSLKDGFINFTLVDDDASFKGSDVYLTINGAQVNCTLAGNNNSLLSCPLPVGVTFPAQIHAAIGDTSTDDFTYDGAGCITQTGPADGGTGPTAPCLGDVCP